MVAAMERICSAVAARRQSSLCVMVSSPVHLSEGLGLARHL
jgi:hypothetical protein